MQTNYVSCNKGNNLTISVIKLLFVFVLQTHTFKEYKRKRDKLRKTTFDDEIFRAD